MKERMYHIVAINERTGKEVVVTGYPMTHDKCCIIKSKMTEYAWRRIVLREV